MKKYNIFKAMLLALLVSWFVLPEIAFAQNIAPSSSPFQVNPDDYFINVLLKGFLGDVVNASGTNAQSTVTGNGTLGEIFQTFNLGVAFFGSILVLFITVVGVLQSGNDGEFLGRKWSSMWVPVRFGTGSVLMLPLTNSGYSFVQAMVLWIASQGIGFADTVWNTIVDKVAVKNTAQVWANIDTSVLAKQVMASQVCAAAVAKYTADSNPVKVSMYSVDTAASDETRGMSTLRTNWGIPGSIRGSSNEALCGALIFSYANVASDPYNDARGVISNQHMNSLRSMAKTFEGPAKTFVDAIDSPDVNALSSARVGIQDAIKTASLRYVFDVSKIASAALTEAQGTSGYAKATEMKKYGFVAAGMFYIDMTRVHTSVRQAIGSTPTYIFPDVSSLKGIISENGYSLTMKDLDDAGAIAISQSNATKSASTTTVGDTTVSSGMGELFPTFSTILQKPDATGILSQFSNTLVAYGINAMFGVGDASSSAAKGGSWEAWRYMTGGSSTVANSNKYSAVMQLKNKGDNILDVGGILLTSFTAGKAAVAGVKAGADAIPIVSAPVSAGAAVVLSILDTLGPMVISLVFSFIAFGFTLAVYVPMVPYVLWISGIVGMMVLIAEALVASALWAVMIMHPSGEGVTSQQSNAGIMLLLGLFTRPSLMLMGLITGMFMVEPLIQLVNDTFYYTMSSVQASSVTGLFSFVGYCAIYVALILNVVNKCFSMIHVMPDKVLRWIGGGSEQLGEGKAREEAKGMVAAIAGTAAGSAGNMLRQRNENKNNKDDKAKKAPEHKP